MLRRPPLLLLHVSVLVATVVCSGCKDRKAGGRSSEPDWTNGPVIYDFVASFPAATFDHDTAHIDLGTPPARGYLVAGWTDHAGDPNATTAFGVGLRSTLEFFRAAAGPVKATFRCKRIAARAVLIDLNGKRQRIVNLKSGWREYRVAFPRTDVQGGRNILQLGYRYAPGTNPFHPEFRRQQAAMECDYVRFTSSGRSRPSVPSVDDDSEELHVPVGKHVDYYVKAPQQAGIMLRGPVGSDAPDARLQVWVQQDGGTDGMLADLGAAGTEVDSARVQAIPLPASGSRIMRISFRAVPGTAAPPSAGTVRVLSPLARRLPVVADGRTGTGRPFGRSAGHQPTDIFIYLIDTLRADHLGCYGYPDSVSPHIDALAKDGVLFERAMANSPWTKPSVASLFTGVWPATHNVLVKGQSLPAEALTLAEILRPAGTHTAAIVANGHVTEGFGFDQGFDRFMFLRPSDKSNRLPPQSDSVNAHVFRWLSSPELKRPLFLYVHTVDPHEPYDPPPSFRSRFASGIDDRSIGSRPMFVELRQNTRRVTDELIHDMRALYAAEIAFNDDSFGRFISELKTRDLYDDALIVLLADHGEAFHEHGTWGHGKNLYGEVVDTPLIIKFPVREGLAGRRIATLAQQVDVMPTILDYLGLPVPPHVEGRSLLRLLRPEDAAASEPTGFAHLHQVGRDQEAVVEGAWKMIRNASGPQGLSNMLYNLAADPSEQNDVLVEHPIVAAYLKAQLQLRRIRTGAVLTPTVGVTDAGVEENLRALGYIE
jgi:arylsulfatase A-like enzyme